MQVCMPTRRSFPPLKNTLLQMLGPSIVFVALSLNGGEMLLWPNLAANYGLAILWPIPLILLLQFIVNIEIERYTLVTGKSVESSLVGKTKWLAIVFACTVLVALVWPAWMTTAGNIFAYALGFREGDVRNYGLGIAIALLLASIGIFRSAHAYRVLEKISKYGLLVALGIIFTIVGLRFDLDTFVAGLQGLVAFGFVPEEMPRFDFVAALAYGGVAGVLNLVQSEWVKDKGYGVNTLGAKAAKGIDYTTPASRKNFRDWFRLINREHFLLFVLANVFSIFFLAYLGVLLLPAGSAQGFQVLVAEIDALNVIFPYLGLLFACAGIVIFIMANVTILDAVGRLVYRMLLPFYGSKSIGRRFSPGKISEYAVYVGIAILVSSILIPSFKQPFFLLVTSASLSAFTMWLYPPLLVKLNLELPAIARPSLGRMLLVLFAAFFYGGVTLWALSAYLPLWVVAALGCAVTLYHIVVLREAVVERFRQRVQR